MTPEQVFPLRPPLAIPNGQSEESIFQFLTSIRPVDAPAAEMQNYCNEDWRRFVYTWGLANGLAGQALELGSNPYFTTLLLSEFSPLQIECANYFNENYPARSFQEIQYLDLASNTITIKMMEFAHFNMEREPFPYADASFDVLFFCEIIEHLLYDPVSAIRECNRVLRPGGCLVLTTPNVSRLENVARMMAGVNIYDPYSGYGPYGRHNREYNRHELNGMLEYCGFSVEIMFTADVHVNRADDYFKIDPLTASLRPRENDLGQYIFVRARRTAIPKSKKPSWLYRSYSPAEID